MELRTCPKCQKPYLASEESCPRCAKTEYTWNQESWANVGCFVLMLLFVFALMLLPFLAIFSIFFRAPF